MMIGRAFQDIYPVIAEVLVIDDADSKYLVVVASHESSTAKKIAVAFDKILTIATAGSDNAFSIVSDSEMDDEIASLVWDGNGSSSIVCQADGVVHFVTANGALVLSHKIFSG